MQTKTTTLILIISLAINLLVIGAAIGFGLRERSGPRFPSHMSGMIKDIDPELRQEMRQKFREQRLAGRALHESMREKQRNLSEAILKEPFDEAAVRAAFAESREARQAIESHMHQQMIAFMANLNPEQRMELTQRLLRINQRKPGPFGHPPPPSLPEQSPDAPPDRS